MRRYNDIPFIADSAELGIAIVKWWHEMQPDFRKSDTEMPSPIYVTSDDSLWSPLRKGGPSGLISVLTLVAWWGQALLDRNKYQDDSTTKWNQLVVDVKDCIHAISAATIITNKRKATAGKENASKR